MCFGWYCVNTYYDVCYFYPGFSAQVIKKTVRILIMMLRLFH